MEALPKPETVEFSISPEDAIAIARLSGRVDLLSAQRELAATMLGAVYDRIRRKNNLPEGASFGWDETGLKGKYEAKVGP